MKHKTNIDMKMNGILIPLSHLNMSTQLFLLDLHMPSKRILVEQLASAMHWNTLQTPY